MKVKFYTLALMASVALGATAAELSPIKLADGIKLQKFDKATILNKINENGKKVAKSAATSSVVEGDYNVTYLDYLAAVNSQDVYQFAGEAFFEEKGDDEFVVTFPFSLSGTELQVEVPVTVSGDKIVFTRGTPVSFLDYQFEVWTFAANDADELDYADKLEVTYNGSGFIMQDMMVAVASETDGWVFGALSPIFQKNNTPESDLTVGWKSMGTATLQDGWIMSNFTTGAQGEPDYLYEVELQQSETDENVYRIINPYGVGTPLADYNEYADRAGFIQFNAADPDHVYLYPVPANFCNSEMGIYQLYPTDFMGMFIFAEGAPISTVIAYMEQSGYPFATLKDGVLTLPSINNGGKWVNSACFGINELPYAGYGWMDESRNTLNMEAKIIFPEAGVEGIVDNTNAPVKYFNLQGVEIANPEKGQLVIKKQGTKTEKLIVR